MYDLLQCVDRGLETFGSNVKQSIYWTLTSKEGISSDRILSSPEAFVRALKEIFGDGYVLAERAIIREMKKTFDLSAPTSSYSIADAFDIVSKDIADVLECTATV